MKITVSGTEKEVPDGFPLKDLIVQEKVESSEYVTVTINENFIAKSDEAATVLAPGDVVEFLYFMGGGR